MKKETQSAPKVPLMEVFHRYPARGIEIRATVEESSLESPTDIDLTVRFFPPE